MTAAAVDCFIHIWSDVAHQSCRSRFADGSLQPTQWHCPITKKNHSTESLGQKSCLNEGNHASLSSSSSLKKRKQSICFRESKRGSENFAVLLTIRGCEHNAVPAPALATNSSDVDIISEGEISPRGTEVSQLVSSSLADQSISSGVSSPEVDNGGIGGGGGGSDGNGSFHRGNGGGGRGGGDSDGDEEESGGQEDEFGPILDGERVQQEVQSRGVTLPPDMLEAAKTVGIRQLLLSRYIELQGAPWPLGPAIRGNTMLRNRMLADPTFLFKVFTEVAIDSGCATFAEIQKRGKDFWSEFELYLSDLSVGIVLDVALVGMLAPFVQFGSVSAVGSGTRARLSRAIQALPSSMFEAQRPGRSFSSQQRVATLFYKAVQYGIAGFACGIVGQGLASSLMIVKRKLKKTEEEEVKVPSIVKSALLWAVFMGVSSNTRYQIINGMERVVEGSVVTRRVPQIAVAFTVGIRFANNIYGGMQFVDWARLAGVQ